MRCLHQHGNRSPGRRHCKGLLTLDALPRCRGRGPGSGPTASAYPSRAGSWGSPCCMRWSCRRSPCSARPMQSQHRRRRVPTTPLLPDRRPAHSRYLPSLPGLRATWGYSEGHLPRWGYPNQQPRWLLPRRRTGLAVLAVAAWHSLRTGCRQTAPWAFAAHPCPPVAWTPGDRPLI